MLRVSGAHSRGLNGRRLKNMIYVHLLHTSRMWSYTSTLSHFSVAWCLIHKAQGQLYLLQSFLPLRKEGFLTWGHAAA
jgi:hypothetical protein